MLFYLNLVFAWIAMIAAFFLVIIYFLRVLNKDRKIKWVVKLNRALRKNHKSIGSILIIFGIVHGILSTDKVLTFNLGTLSWVVSILLGLSFIFRKRFYPQRLWMSLHRFLTIAFVSILVIHIIDVGGFAIDDVLFSTKASASSYVYDEDNPTPQTLAAIEATPTQSPTQTIEVEPSLLQTPTTTPLPTQTPTPEPLTKYIDGVYQGTADGFRPGLTVEIELINDEIIRVDIVAHNEIKERFWSVPVEYLPQWIIQEQTTDVDTVSGATLTSVGIINATNEALNKALR